MSNTGHSIQPQTRGYIHTHTRTHTFSLSHRQKKEVRAERSGEGKRSNKKVKEHSEEKSGARYQLASGGHAWRAHMGAQARVKGRVSRGGGGKGDRCSAGEICCCRQGARRVDAEVHRKVAIAGRVVVVVVVMVMVVVGLILQGMGRGLWVDVLQRQ